MLLEGVPGVAKTLLIRALGRALSPGGQAAAVHAGPDAGRRDRLADLRRAHGAEFEFRAGPVFTNLLLADEINRTPPKTQAALLEAMEERQVSVEGEPRPLPAPFLVAATQNPVEYEGTYPLPEAQLDRFMLKLTVPLPERAERDLDPGSGTPRASTRATWPRPGSARWPVPPTWRWRAGTRRARCTSTAEVTGYIVDLCRATRQLAVAAARRLAAWCHRAACDQPGVGLARPAATT